MTDTVNVPREAVAKAIRDAVGHYRMSADMAEIAANAALAAAPKAEPDWNYEGAMADLESAITVLIRRINGEADLASAAEWVRLNYPSRAGEIVAHPEAPKPVGHFIFTGSAWEEVHDAFAHHHDVTPLYTHPAQASDARVISYEEAHATAVEMGYPSLTEALEDLERLQKDRDAFDGLGDSAPASDELLKALEEAETAIGGADISKIRHSEGGVALAKKVVDLKSASQNIIAMHKGPQS